MRRLEVSLCLFMVLALGSSAEAIIYWGDFDWRNYSGGALPAGNYVTPVRDQRSLPSCWSFGATAAVEAKYLIDNQTPGVNLDLSEQQLVCDSSTGMGGHEDLALNYYRDVGVTTEANLPYISKNTSPLWPLDRPYGVYKITGVKNNISRSLSNIKYYLETTGPLACALDVDYLMSDPGSFGGEANADAPKLDFSIPEIYRNMPHHDTIGPDTPAGGDTHCVCIVGYKDVSTMPEGGYWIIKNSWGDWGDDGYGFVKYGKISRVHAITGTTYTSTQPSWAPVAVSDAFTIGEDGKLICYQYDGVRANDTDVNTPREALTAVKLTNPAHGTLELNPNGSLSYTPDPDFYGVDTFTYRAFDGVQYSNVATVAVDVISVNDVPVAVDDVYTCAPGGSLLRSAWEGALMNDDDADNRDPVTSENDTLAAVLESGLANGTIDWYSSGAFKYTPNAGFTGVDSLTYKVSDGKAWSNLATVTFLVGVAETAAVPEPSTVALLAAAVLGLVARRRRERAY